MNVQLKSHGSFDAYLRRGAGACLGQRVQLKYNHCHDQANGQFTFASGNCSDEASGPTMSGNATARGAARRFSVGAGTVPKTTGPFENHALKMGKAGDAARAMNRIVSDPRANENFDLGGHSVNIRRTGPDTVRLSMGGSMFTAEGSYARVPGKQAIDIVVRKRSVSSLASLAMNVTSFPNHIRIFETQNKRLAYKIDRPITARAFGRSIQRAAGTFYFDE